MHSIFYLELHNSLKGQVRTENSSQNTGVPEVPGTLLIASPSSSTRDLTPAYLRALKTAH